MKGNNRSPWAWIPTLYFMQGLPYVAVVTISTIMYKRMGMSNTDLALYTSWLYLPWVIKPLWSPIVDMLKTKRWWILIMQVLIGVAFAGVAFTIPTPFWGQASLAFFWIMAFSSATHDIAADGFYMLALKTQDQAKYVGIRSTFYRISTVVGQGALVILAGFIETSSGKTPLEFKIDTSPQYTHTILEVPKSSDIVQKDGDIHFVTSASSLQIGTTDVNKDSLDVFLKKVHALNEQNGFILKEGEKEKKQDGWWTKSVSKPFGSWIKNNFGEKIEKNTSNLAGDISIVAINLSKEPGTEEEIVLNTSLQSGDKSISVVQGERLSFTQNNWNKTAYIVFQADPKLEEASNATFKGMSGNIPFAWSVVFFVLAVLFIGLFLYHRVFLPKPTEDEMKAKVPAGSIMDEFFGTFKSFFKKPQIAAALFFMLTFRFAEAQLLKLINPFLLDPKDVGGLGLTTGEVGFVYGTLGIIGLTLGGIIGGLAAAKGGLKKWLWPMTLSMLLTAATFLFLSFTQTESLLLINICVFIEQFGYGFGFTAYMLYLMYFADGEHKTAHYAICTGFMALGMMIPGMFAGWLQEQLGYNHFFLWVMICSIVPIIAVSLLKVDPNYGKPKAKEEGNNN